MSTSRFKQVNELLDYFNEYQDEVDAKKSIVKNFLNRLKAKFDKKNFIIRGSKFYKVGSSYEDTVVSPKADFDIAMVLASPFTMDSFELVDIEYEGFYKPRCLDDSEYLGLDDSEYLDEFVNSNHFLKVEKLRNKIFDELTSIMKNMAFDGYCIKFHAMGSNVNVILQRSNESVKMDIVPQIGGNAFRNIPGWRFDNMSELVRKSVSSNDLNILFNLSCPPDLQHMSYSHLVVQPSFNLIEKDCMLDAEVTADAVRLAKAVCKTHNLSKDGLRSFHIKRVALDLLDEIEDTGDAWDGYKMIMRTLIDMLEEGGIDGCFIEDQNIMTRGEVECQELGFKMKKIVNKIQPNNILSQLNLLLK